MKQKQLIKILLILTLTVFFTACNDTKKGSGYTATLPMPSTKGLSNMGLIGLAHDAKKDPIPATKIGYAYSEELKDYAKAIEWYKYSNSMKPMPDNSNYMCYAYQMKKEYKEAIKWCKNAIELGSDETLFQIGKIYEDLKNYTEAITWYEQSALKNNIKAMNNLGFIYNEKVIDLKKSEE